MDMTKQRYDIGAYIWPAYCQNDRTDMFWPDGIGEWQTVKTALPKFEGHRQPRVPVWGYCDEADPKVMEMQIKEALDHGVNVFIYDWYWYDKRPFLENCLNDGFLKASNNEDMQFYLMWANHDALAVWDKRLSDRKDILIWSGAQDRTQFEIICRRVIDQYFNRPNYYKVNGCPIFSIYDLDTLIQGLGGLENTKQALADFRALTKQAGFPDLHLQCILRKHLDYCVTGISNDNVGVQQEVVETLGFDSLTHYQYCHFMGIGSYPEMVKTAEEERKQVARDYTIPYCPHVSVGWDNNPRFYNLRPDVTTGNNPEEFEKALKSCMKFIDNNKIEPKLITVNSWNEWTETSYLQPDTEFGYGYLDAVKRALNE